MSMVEQRPPEVTVVDRGESTGPPRSRATRSLGVMVALVVLAVLVVVGLEVFQGCWIDVGNELDHQPSVGYVTPPRGSAAEAAVPLQGRDYVVSLGPPTNPIPPSKESEATGEALYPVFCRLCHGEPGSGTPGGVGATFAAPPPPDLKAMAAALPEGQIFVVITEGFGRMPALAALFPPVERWDVINYLRSLTPGLQPAPPGDARLRAVRQYADVCAECHGATAQGALGPALYPSTFLTESSLDQIAAMISAGRQSQGMPAFSARLSPQDLDDMAVMLKDLQREGPTVISDALVQLHLTTTTVPGSATTTTTGPTTTTTGPGVTTTTGSGGATTTTGSDAALIAAGQKVFDANCQPCHGANGSGGVGPKLQPNAFIGSSQDAQVRATIENGRPGTAMPAWKGRISDQDVTAVVALLRSWQGAKAAGASQTTSDGVQLPFSHVAHTSKGMACLFCHSTARRGPPADLPALQLCALCHEAVAAPTAPMKEVVAAYDAGATVSWPRVYRVRDFVYFAHRDHVVTAKIDCSHCHGDVATMTLAVKKVNVDNMGFCLACHTGKTVNGKSMTDCDICHK